jgi:tRNA pseudouridine32 synthase/23S rRNA pseudouridine746 synthase
MYSIIEQHEDFLVISKHPGTDFHKGPNSEGLTERLRKDIGRDEIFPVHRLDKITSGLLVFATTKESLLEFSRLFREKQIQKIYIAIGDNKPKKKQGPVKGDMIKGRNGIWILSHSLKNPAVTWFFSYGLGNGLRLYILRPLTGKTHQLRVALKSIGAPVLGDEAYAGNRYLEFLPDRAYLHAFALRFSYKEKEFSYLDNPDTGRYFLDANFKAAMAKAGDPWLIKWPQKSVISPLFHSKYLLIPAKTQGVINAGGTQAAQKTPVKPSAIQSS